MNWQPSREHYQWLRKQEYKHLDSSLDYCVQKEGDTLTVLFQESDNAEDWASNLNFFPKKFEIFERSKVKVHRGIAEQYMSVRDELFDLVYNSSIKTVYISGFSLGCGLVQLFTYDVLWHIRRDGLAVNVVSFGYDGPRVFCPNKGVKKLMKDNFTHIKNRCDPVVHVPWKIMPTFFYFRWKPFKLRINWKGLLSGRLTFWTHVGKQVWIGRPWPWPVKHLPEEIEKSLLKKFGR